LDLGENSIGPEGILKLGESLKTHVRMHQIFLDNNNLKGEKAAEGLCSALKHKRDLRIFNVDNNNLGPDGMIKLAEGLKVTTGLLNLYVFSNNIETEGALALAECLEGMEDLKKI